MPLVYVPDNTFASPYLNPYVSHYPTVPIRCQQPSYNSAPSYDDYDGLAHYFCGRPSARAAQLQQQRQEELEDARTRQLFSQFLGGLDSTPKSMVGKQRKCQQAAYVAEQQRRLMLARQQQEEEQRRQQMLRLQVQQRTQQEHVRRLAAQQYTREQQQLTRPWNTADAAALDSDTDEEMEEEQPRHSSSPVACRNSSPITHSIFADQLGALMNFSAVRSDLEGDEQEQEQPTSPIQRRLPSSAASAPTTITTARSPSPAQSSSPSTRSLKPSALTQLRRLQQRTTSLIANTSTATLLESTHYLTQVLLEADAIDAQGEALVRSERKKLVQRVEDALRELEREDQERDKGFDASTEVSSSSEDKGMMENAGFESKAESSSVSSSSSDHRRAYKVTIEDASESDME